MSSPMAMRGTQASLNSRGGGRGMGFGIAQALAYLHNVPSSVSIGMGHCGGPLLYPAVAVPVPSDASHSSASMPVEPFGVHLQAR